MVGGGKGCGCLRRGRRTGAREVAKVRTAVTWAAERCCGRRRQPLYGQGRATAVGGGGEGGGEAAATAEAEPAWTVEAEDVVGEVGVEPEMLLTGEDNQWLHEERTASRRSGSKSTLAERGVGKLTVDRGKRRRGGYPIEVDNVKGGQREHMHTSTLVGLNPRGETPLA